MTEQEKKEYQKKWRNANKDKIKAYKKIYRKENKEFIRESGKKYEAKNKDILKVKKKKYYELNKDILNKKNKEYQLNNIETVKEYKKKYQQKESTKVKQKEYRDKNKKVLYKRAYKKKKERLKTDFLFKFKSNVRSAVYNSIYRNGFTKNSKTFKIIGCTFEKFITHIEKQFKSWMNWENYGKYNGELDYGWDLDHIIPIDYAKTKEETLKLNHYTNFQPLCGYTNRYIKKTTLPV